MRTSTTQSGLTGRDPSTFGGSAALASTLMLLGIGYVLLVTAPLVFQRFPVGPLAALAGAAWVPAAAAGGLAVGGAAAFVFVLARLVRDLDREPYACLAPVLAVFTAFVLVGLRVKLPLAGLPSEHVSALSVAVAVAGGALLMRGGVGPAIMGTVVALLPTSVLVAVAWAASGRAAFGAFVAGLDPQLRVFMGLLGASSLAMLGVALVARAARGRVVVPVEPSVRLPVPRREEADAAVWQRLRAEADTLPPRPRRITSPKLQAQVSAALDSIDIERLTWSGGFPTQDARKGSTPVWLIAVLSLTALGAVAMLGHRAYVFHQNRSRQLAVEAAVQREHAAQREAAEKAKAAVRSQEAAAAAERLEALLAAPPVVAAPPAAPATPAPVAAPVAAEPSVAARVEQANVTAPVQAASAEDDRESREARRARHEERARRRKARRDAAAKVDRVERAAQAATDRAVGGTLNASSDPIYGL